MANIAQARAMLRVGPPGRTRLWSQRAEPRPFLNCRFWSWLSQAWWAGLRWGGREDALAITELLRRQSGHPEFVGGVGQGTSSSDLERAINNVFPWMRVTFRMVPDPELRSGLGDKWTAGVGVWLPDLPPQQQRWAGSAEIGHQCSLMGAKDADVLFLDPLGIHPYDGDWVRWRAITPAFMQRRGESTFCTLMEKGDHMLTTVDVARAFVAGKGDLPKGTYQTFRVRGDDFERVSDITVKVPTTVSIGYIAEVHKRPTRAPEGRFAFILDGEAAGRFIRTGSIDHIRETNTGGEDAAYNRGLVDGASATLAQFQPVETELYQRNQP